MSSTTNGPTPVQLNAALLSIRIASGLAFLYHGSAILFGAFGGPGHRGSGFYTRTSHCGLPSWLSPTLRRLDNPDGHSDPNWRLVHHHSDAWRHFHCPPATRLRHRERRHGICLDSITDRPCSLADQRRWLFVHFTTTGAVANVLSENACTA